MVVNGAISIQGEDLMNILGKLTHGEVEDLRRIGRGVTFESGQAIVRDGETDQSLGLLLKGCARVVKTGPEGRRFVLAFIEEGECFGELALILGIPRSATIEAMGRCEVLMISAEQFSKHCQAHRGFERALLLLTAQRLHRTSLRASGVALLDTTSRVLAHLTEIGELVETPQGPARRCELANQTELAELVGTSREMVSRALKLLEQTGEIRRSGRLILIPIPA